LDHKELIDGCIKCRKSAQDGLYQKYAGRLFAVCLRYTRNRMEAEDLLQEGFVKIFKSIHTLKSENEQALYPWMRRILINHTLNYLRDQKKYRFTEDIDVYTDQCYDSAGEEDLNTYFEPLEPEEVFKLINALPDGYRTVFNLYAFEEYTHQEIADALGISVSTSKTQLLKARRTLVAGIQKKTNSETNYKLVI